jgi:nucleotide-binding universal stress UspA family protein
MKNRTLLFVMNETTSDAEVRRIAEHATDQNARVMCLILSMAPTYPMDAYGAMPYGRMDFSTQWVEELASARKALQDRAESLEALLQSDGLSGDVQPVQCTLADARDVVARRALVADLATVAENLREDDPDLRRMALYGVLLQSPAALVQNCQPLALPKRVLVAWNTELPASRAIHTALPVLKHAKEVIIACFDPKAEAAEDGEDPGADLAKWLSHHGLKVTLNQYPTGGQDVALGIQRHAIELGADLVVMGAYGRSRMREFLFGGTTRAMMEQTKTPIFMTH